MFRFVLSLALVLAIVHSSPLERKNERPLVIDVPADIPAKDETFDEPQVSGNQEKVSLGKDVEIIPIRIPDEEKVIGDSGDSSIEDVDLTPSRDTDFFGFRLPSLFIYRRPAIRDPFLTSPFNSFPIFQQQQPQQFSPVQPGSFNVMSHMEAMMKRMQEQMTSLWGALSPTLNRTPIFQRPVFNIDTSVSESGEKESPDVVNLDNLPANYSNSTSETKLVDGQLVTVNKTIHKISSNDSSGFFSVQVIKIRPQNYPTQIPTEVTHEVAGSAPSESTVVKSESESEESAKKTPSPTPTNEAVTPTVAGTTSLKTEDPSMNEIDGHQKRAEFSPVDADQRFKELYDVEGSSRKPNSDADNDNDNVEQLVDDDEFQVVPLERYERQEARSLADDIRINKILEEDNRKGPLKMVNPDVEVFIL